MIRFNLPRLTAITPKALPVYREAFVCAHVSLVPFGILNNELRAEHFLAQVIHESGGLRHLTENLNYSALRLKQVWPSRFPTVQAAEPYAHNPEKLANKVYAGRLGNTQPGDGWKYIGRGAIQLTGRANYQKIGSILDANFVDTPGLVVLPEYVLLAAAAFWRSAGCNELADQDDLRAVTKAVNGGYVGLPERARLLEECREIVQGRI